MQKIRTEQIELRKLKELKEVVLIACNPPEKCNEPEVLKEYMKACFDKAKEI